MALCALEGILPKSGKSWHIAHTELINYLTPDEPYNAICKKVVDINNEKVNMIVLKSTDGVNVAERLVSADLVKVAGNEARGVETVSPKAQQGAAVSPSSAQSPRDLSDSRTERFDYLFKCFELKKGKNFTKFVMQQKRKICLLF